MRILIVDDNATMRRTLRMLIESRTECTVCGEAADGVEAIEQARKLRPELVVMDFAMPRMNGLDAASRLRDILPDTRVVMFTFLKDELSKSAVRAAGIAAVIAKPEGIEALLEELDRAPKARARHAVVR